jgi:hypothetical protein
MKPGDPGGRKPASLSLRWVVILALAVLVGLGAGALDFAAYHSIALAVMYAGGAFAGTVVLLNMIIELWSAVTSGRQDVTRRGLIGHLVGVRDHLARWHDPLAIKDDSLGV